MSFESFPKPENEIENPANPAEGPHSASEHERFGWNDVIVPESDLLTAEKIIEECGFECKSEVIPENRQYLDNDPQKKAFDEFVVSVTYPGNKEPVDRETLKEVVAALRNGDRHVVVRVARLAPGERFG